MTDEIDPRAPRDFTVAIRKGTTIDTFLTYKIDPPITAEEDGRYLALLNEEKGTATLQRVGGWPEAPKPDPYEDEDENRWAAFTNDELIGIGFTAENPSMSYVIEEIEAEMDRRGIPWGTSYRAENEPTVEQRTADYKAELERRKDTP